MRAFPVSQPIGLRKKVALGFPLKGWTYHLTLVINGVPVHTIVDTGASDLVLTRTDAERVGLLLNELIFAGRANTANGRVETAHVKLDKVSLGPIEDRLVPALVNGGEMNRSLLGMSYLSRFASGDFRKP